MKFITLLLNALGYRFTIIRHDRRYFHEKARYSNVHILKQPVNRSQINE